MQILKMNSQQIDILYVRFIFCLDVLVICVFESQLWFWSRFLTNESLMLITFSFFTSGAFWFWNSAVVEPCSWEDMANMYGTDCITKVSLAHHTLVLGKVQTMDCCMYHLPNIIYPILWFCLIISFWVNTNGFFFFFQKIFNGHHLGIWWLVWPRSVKSSLEFSAVFSFGV